MQTLSFLKNPLTRLYFFVLRSNYYLAYKYIVITAFKSGHHKILYLLRFFSPLNHISTKLFLIFATSLHVFTPLLRVISLIAPLRFWVLGFHHFLVFYQAVLTLRLIFTWYPSINYHKGGVIENTVFGVTEPYFRTFQKFLPSGIIAAIFSFYLVEIFSYILEISYRSFILYGGVYRKKTWFKIFYMMSLAGCGETLLPA